MISFLQFLKEASSKKGEGSTCIMLYFDKLVDPLFKEIKYQIDKDHLYGVDDGYGFETNPHVTVKYGVIEPDLDMVNDILGKIDPVPIKTKPKFSLFENEKYDVLKVNIMSPELRKFNARVERIFDCEENKFKGYIPHSTIAYLQPGYGRKYLNMESDFLDSEYLMTRLVISGPTLDKKYVTLK